MVLHKPVEEASQEREAKKTVKELRDIIAYNRLDVKKTIKKWMRSGDRVLRDAALAMRRRRRQH